MTRIDPKIIVDINGVPIVLTGTPEDFVIQSSVPSYVTIAKHNTENPKPVALIHGAPYILFTTGKKTFLELVASIVAVNPNEAVIVEAPEEVKELIILASGPSDNITFN